MPPEDTNLDVNDTEVASSTTSDVASAESSPAQDDRPLSEVVREAAKKSGSTEVEHTEAPDSSTEEEADTKVEASEEEQAETEESEKKEEPKNDEAKPTDKDKALPFHNHPRWKEVLTERNTAQAEVEKLKPQAATAQALQQYCETNGISQQDLEQALELTALSRKDVPQFRKRMGEFLDNIDIVQGTKLPTDLQKKVDDGVIDPDSARELAQHRIKVKQAEGQSMNVEQRAAQQLTQSISTGLDAWEASQKTNDTGFDNRKTLLKSRITELWVANPPTSVQAAIRIAEQANKEVKAAVEKFIPKPPKRKVLKTNSSSTNNGESFKLDNLETDLGPLVRAVAARHR